MGAADTAHQTPTLSALLDETVARHGERVALRVDVERWTYAELGSLVDRVAADLAAHGVGNGSRVALSAGNSVRFVAVVFAAARLGAAIVTISTAWRDAEVRHALAVTEPTHVVHDGSAASRLDALVADRPLLRIGDLGTSDAASPTNLDVGADELAVMMFSSGTTGLPKAVRHSHRTMRAATEHWTEALGLGPDDRLQIATPPFHILGLLNMLAVVSVGASVRLHRRFELDTVLRTIEADRITVEMAVAPIALAMASHSDLERFDLSSLRYIMWGATPVTASVADTVTRRTGIRFLAAYGATEVPVIAANPVDRPDDWRLDSVGLPPAGVEVRVVDGELHVRSPSRMIGYLPDDDGSIVDGWYRTGDLGTVDPGGWITITDRVKEMIKVNGFQVAPAEVEAVLLGHPGVVDCAVFGVPDERTGEAVAAAVVASPGVDVSADDLRALVTDRLASYKRVERVLFLERIPRLPSGKVLRRELKATHAG